VLLFVRITGEIWIVGGLAILMHTIDIIQKMSNQTFTFTGFYVIFGLKVRYEPVHIKSLSPIIIIFVAIFIIWNGICIFLIKKGRKDFYKNLKYLTVRTHYFHSFY